MTASSMNLTLLVVDNSGGESSTPRDFPEGVSLIFETKIGIPHARNAAINWGLARQFSWLIFLDDDVMPAANWLTNLLDSFQAGPWDVVQGKVVYEYPKDYPEHYPRLPIPQNENVEKLAVASTTNVIFGLSPVRELNLRFRENLTETGGSDTAFFYSLTEAGYTIGYCENAIVVEDLVGSRATLRWQIRRRVRTSQDWFSISGGLVKKGEKFLSMSTFTRIRGALLIVFRLLQATIWVCLRPKVGRKAFLEAALNTAPLIAYFLLVFGIRIREYRPRSKPKIHSVSLT